MSRLIHATFETKQYAVFKTTKHLLSFVILKTKVDYQVVAPFALQEETTAAISEAFSV